MHAGADRYWYDGGWAVVGDLAPSPGGLVLLACAIGVLWLVLRRG